MVGASEVTDQLDFESFRHLGDVCTCLTLCDQMHTFPFVLHSSERPSLSSDAVTRRTVCGVGFLCVTGGSLLVVIVTSFALNFRVEIDQVRVTGPPPVTCRPLSPVVSAQTDNSENSTQRETWVLFRTFYCCWSS